MCTICPQFQRTSSVRTGTGTEPSDPGQHTNITVGPLSQYWKRQYTSGVLAWWEMDSAIIGVEDMDLTIGGIVPSIAKGPCNETISCFCNFFILLCDDLLHSHINLRNPMLWTVSTSNLLMEREENTLNLNKFPYLPRSDSVSTQTIF